MRFGPVAAVPAAVLAAVPHVLAAQASDGGSVLADGSRTSLRAGLVIAAMVAAGTLAGWMLSRGDGGNRRFW